MVLQRLCAAPVWGNDTPGQTVTVAFAGQRVRAVADAQGRWLARLAPLRASTQPSTLIIAGSTRVALTNVLVGDVWVCSGQSNMEWPLFNASNGAAEVAAAGQYPTLRLFTVPRATALTPQTTNDGTWEVSGPKTAGDFSAVATFFGRELIARRGVPIGLIDSSWGGTPIESWTRRAALEAIPFMTNRLKGADEAVAKYDPKKVKEQFERAGAAQAATLESAHQSVAAVQSLQRHDCAAAAVRDSRCALVSRRGQCRQCGAVSNTVSSDD
jgi:sialate O-acetylesterase